MSGVFKNIDHTPPHRPASVCPPPLVRGEGDTLAGRRGGGGSIFWKTTDTALYYTYVSTLCLKKYLLCALLAYCTDSFCLIEALFLPRWVEDSR
jgi:hypothetical protein